MGGGGSVSMGKKKMDDPEAAATAAKRAGARPAARKDERWVGRGAGAVLIICLVTLPLLVFFFQPGERADAAASTGWHNAPKLAAASGGYLNTSTPGTTGASTTNNHDELFGGLLAPGFDPPACLSRHESPQYYKHSPYTPSRHLLHKLRSYEARHRRCGPGTPLYANSVERLRSGRRRRGATECSYVVWIPYNGLGNRMLTLLGTFLYALLTDRVLLVHSPNDFTDLFCEPFPGATWLLPPDFPVADLSQLGVNSDQSYGNLLGNKKITNDPTNTTVLSMQAYVYLHLAHDHWYNDGLFYCNDDQLVLAKAQWLLLQSDLYFVPQLYTIAEFHDELHLLFPWRESVSHLLGRYLFHPTNSVWGLVTRYYHSYLAHAKERIGVQVRMFNWASVPVDDMYKQILECSRQEHILPDTDGDEAPEADDTNGGGPTTSIIGAATAAVPTSTAILVTSLQADYYERIKSMYYEHAAKGGGWVGVYQPSHEEWQDTGRRWHNQKALAEIFLLSFSDVLLTTGASTFGYTAAVLAGLRPVILMSAHDHKAPETPCMRAVSMEPCFHKQIGVNCSGKAVDTEELSRHVKVCEDYAQGVKLFD